MSSLKVENKKVSFNIIINSVKRLLQSTRTDKQFFPFSINASPCGKTTFAGILAKLI